MGFTFRGELWIGSDALQPGRRIVVLLLTVSGDPGEN